MPGPIHHLAQINIARMLAPIDSPQMADFVDRLPAVNALAESSPGFVWRLQTAEGDATSLQPYPDPMILVNMSVWETVEDLKAFTYKTGHSGPLRDRARWFEKPTHAHMAMWWIPAGHIPTVEEGVARLGHRRTHGDSPYAFSFQAPYPAPGEPASAVEAAV
jgi:hypothetical protein